MTTTFSTPTSRKNWTITQVEGLAKTLKALGHPVRLSIIEMLRNGDKLTVTDIYKGLQADQSAISHHLILLKKRGVLDAERNGKYIHYYLKQPEILPLIDCLSESRH